MKNPQTSVLHYIEIMRFFVADQISSAHEKLAKQASPPDDRESVSFNSFQFQHRLSGTLIISPEARPETYHESGCLCHPNSLGSIFG